MLKQYFGSSAVGSRRVESPEEAEREAERLFELVRDPSGADKLYPMCGFAHGGARTGVLLMEFVEGTEHDVDLILFDGEVVDAFVSDNGPVDLPTCAETIALMPSALSPGRAQQLVAAAHQACEAVGLRHGVINVELKLSPTGPKVIDINGRMGGFYNPSWIHAIWQADLPAAVCAVAMGVRPDRRLTDEPRCHIAGVMIFPADRPDIHAARDRGALIVDMRTPGVEPQLMEYPEPDFNVGTRGESAADAVRKLVELLPHLLPERPERVAILSAWLAGLLPCSMGCP